MKKNRYLIIGKLPPPYYGTSVWFEALHDSIRLKDEGVLFYDISINRSIETMSKLSLSKILSVYRKFRGFGRFISHKKPDLVLIPLSQSFVGFLRDSFFIRKAFSLGITPLLILHGSKLLSWYKLQNFIVRRYVYSCISKAGGAIVLGDCLKYIFEPFLSSDRIYSVPNGLNLTIPTVTKNSGKLQFLYLGNLQATKGITDVIKAVSLVEPELRSHIHLNVVGSWRDKKTMSFCYKIVSKNNLPVTFRGPLYGNEKYLMMAQCDVLVFTPRAPEGHPMVIIEAMAAALPIIATDQGAINESVKNGINGYLVQAEDPAAIAEKMEFFIENSMDRKRMGEESRRLYEENFTGERMIGNLIGVFRSILKNQKGIETIV